MAPHSPPHPRPSAESCPHEQRPGTTMCLHCRHEARMVAKERRRRLMLRGSAFASILLVLGSVGTIGAVTLHRRNASRPAARKEAPRAVVVAASTPVADSTVTVAPSAPASAPIPTPIVATPLKPVLPEGTTTLSGGMTAVRHDSVVVLSFDFAGARTRMPDRFERLVRTTLPAVYGARADSAMRAIPDGGIARQGDLFSELAERGIRIPVSTGWAIALYPITRTGRDGPLVTQYRVTVTKS